MVHSKQIIIAGLIVNVFSLVPLADSLRPVVALFFLHGRHGSASAIEGYVEVILRESQPPRGLDDERDLMIITFVCNLGQLCRLCRSSTLKLTKDHRNHGSRLKDKKANDGWSKKPELSNDRHA